MSDVPDNEFLNIKEQYEKFIDENIVIDDDNIKELETFSVAYEKIRYNSIIKLQTDTLLQVRAMKIKLDDGTFGSADMQAITNMESEWDGTQQRINEMWRTVIKFHQMCLDYYCRKAAQVRLEAEAARDAEDSDNAEGA